MSQTASNDEHSEQDDRTLTAWHWGVAREWIDQ
jgi:hypothetical protein